MLERIVPPLGSLGILLLPELFKQILFALRKIGRRLHFDVKEFVARTRRPQIFHAFAAEFENPIGLGAFRDFDAHVAVDGRNIDRHAKRAIDETEGNIDMNIVAFPLEGLVRLDLDFDVKIAIRPAIHAALAFAAHADLLARRDAGRNVHIEILMNPDVATPAANMTAISDDLPGTMAAWARPGAFHDAENRLLSLPDVARAPAIGANVDVIWRIGASAMAVFAGLIIGKRNAYVAAIDGIHEVDLDPEKGILAFARRAIVPPASLPAASEEALEDIVQIDIAIALPGEVAPIKGVARSAG